MNKNLALLALALAMTAPACAADPSVKDGVTKDGTAVAPQVATPPKASKVDGSGAKGKVVPAAAKDGAKDPYEVPLLKGARPLGGGRD